MDRNKDRYHFILSHTQFASNLGLATRVMKNMGFENLILVRPECEVGLEARARSMRGSDVLDRCRLRPSLEAALEDVDMLVGTTGRAHRDSTRWTTSRRFAEEIAPRFPDSRIGLAFGSESNGLSKEEVALCQWLLEIPTESGYPVINLAQAAAIVAYDLHMSGLDRRSHPALQFASSESVESLLERVESLLEKSTLPEMVDPQRILDRLRRLAARANLERDDVNMIRGLIDLLDIRKTQ